MYIMLKETNNWLKMVDYDLKTAEHMFETKRYIYVIFLCHLAIEKTLKAFVSEETKKFPPKTHNLMYLTNVVKITFEKNFLDFIGIMNNVSIVTRYPEDISKLVKYYPKNTAKEYLNKTKEIISWIKKDKRLEK